MSRQKLAVIGSAIALSLACNVAAAAAASGNRSGPSNAIAFDC
jgi:hypothetical protein